jgi:serine/threonine-protein kinase
MRPAFTPAVVICAGLLAAVIGSSSPLFAETNEPSALALRAHDVLRKHCFSCHGEDPKKVQGDGLNVLDHSLLLKRELLSAGKPGDSVLIQRVEAENPDERMPPAPQAALPAADRKVLRDWIEGGAVPFPARGGSAENGELAAEAKEILRTRCLECHGGTKTSAGVKILDRELLVQKRKIIAGRPDESSLYRLVTAEDGSMMPPNGQPRLSERELGVIRRWIAAGAPPFPADVPSPESLSTDPALKGVVGSEYVLRMILEHVRKTPGRDRPYLRYFSINHLLRRGVTREELELHRDAFAKAVNHLSSEPKIVRPVAIDEPVRTVFAIDLRTTGWHRQPFQKIDKDGKEAGLSSVNLFDLVLLEYPYATLVEDSETFDRVLEEYVLPGKLVRPIPYVRVDWFVSVATQSPLYEDLLQLPRDLRTLETRLGVTSRENTQNGVARRAGMAVSGVSRNNRVVERHPSLSGAYWKSFDFGSSRGRENMFLDPIHLDPAGGEMIFNLPNGLQGYFLANGKGTRVNEAPTSIVTDKFAEDHTVRNGLACMRCHDRGMKTFSDDVRQAVEKLPGSPGFSKRDVLDLYAPHEEMDRLVQEDTDRFSTALTQALGKTQTRESLIPVSQRFLETPLQLSSAAAELGLPDHTGLAGVFLSPRFSELGLIPLGSGGVVRRDMWEDYFDDVVRQLGIGIPVNVTDGLTRTDLSGGEAALDIQLTTDHPNNLFAAGDGLVIHVKNRSKRDVYIELTGASSDDRRVILVPSTTVVKAGEQYRFPSEGSLKVQAGLGKEQVTLFASDSEFPSGELLRGQHVSDRIVHRFFNVKIEDRRPKIGNAPRSFVKKTLVIETK